jgi:hypothetical protein
VPPGSYGARQLVAAGAGGARRRLDQEQEASGGRRRDEAEEEESLGGDTQERPAPRPSIWALKGALAGRLATDKARKGEPYEVDAPAAAVTAGAEAEMAWLTAFFKEYVPGSAPAPIDDRRVSGLVAPKRRRISSKPEPNKAGRAGLDDNAEAVVSTATYAWVRSEFFLPADHLAARVRDSLKEEGFEFNDTDVASWWEEKGHSLTLTKAKSARHSIVDSVKSGIWLAHGTLRHVQ